MTAKSASLVAALRGPLMLVTLGSLFLLDYSGHAGFGRTWPVLLIVFGILKLLEYLLVKPIPANPAGTDQA